MLQNQKPEQLELSNGIPVIFQNYDGAVAAFYWWIQAGSADELRAQAGFAHFLEHMHFKDSAAKDTGKPSTGQLARQVESLGGDVNAYTSFDQTVYHVTCAAQHWEKVLDVFGTMAKPQRFLKHDFDSEREVILEELRKNEDSPSRQLFQALFSASFQKHPYGKPVIGFTRTLKAAKVGDLENFYKKNYTSDRMGLILVGPYDEKRKTKILQLLEKHYGKKTIPSRKGVRIQRPSETEIRKKPELVTKSFDVKTPSLAISFRVPDLKHDDIPALDLASSVLSMGELSRMYQSLFYGTSLVTDISGGMYVPSDPGMIYLNAELQSSDKIHAALEAILTEIVKLRDEGPQEEELKRVMVNAESERLYATQTADGMAGRIGFLKFILGDLDFDREYLEKLRDVNAEKIREVVAKYFTPERMSLVIQIPKTEKKYEMKPLASAIDRILGHPRMILKPKPTSLTSMPELIQRPSGIKWIFQSRAQSHVMSIHASCLGGTRLELSQPIESAEFDWGSSQMLSLTWNKGTTHRNAKSIAATVEGAAAGLDGFSGRNTTGLQMTGLARDWDSLSDLFGEILLEPSFPDDEVAHSKRVTEDNIRSMDDHSAQLCSKLFLETLFDRHPYGKLSYGSLESLSHIYSSKLRAFHKIWVKPERLVISMVGNLSRAKAEKWIEKIEQKMSDLRLSSGDHPALFKVDEEAALKAPRWVERKLGREQSHIIVGGLGTKITHPDRYAIQLLQTLLGGQSGRLFIELREKKSLAYSVAPISFEGIERGYIGTYIACSPSKRDEAVSGIAAVLETLAKKGPSSAEMKRAKEFFLGRRAMDLQSDGSLASHYGLEAIYGLPLQTPSDLYRNIEKISAKDIQEVCRKYLVEAPMVTSVVG